MYRRTFSEKVSLVVGFAFVVVVVLFFATTQKISFPVHGMDMHEYTLEFFEGIYLMGKHMLAALGL